MGGERLIFVIGTNSCSRCYVVQNILTGKKIEFTYKNIDELDFDEQIQYVEQAKQLGQSSYPMIFKDGKLINIDDLAYL